MEDALLNLNNQDETIARTAAEWITDQMNDPSFLLQLFCVIDNSDEIRLLNCAAIAILEMIRKKWSILGDNATKKEILDKLLFIIYNKQQVNTHVLESTLYVFADSTFDPIPSLQETLDIFLIKEKIDLIPTALSVVLMWLKMRGHLSCFYNKSNLSILSNVFSGIYSYLNCKASISTCSTAIEILKIVSSRPTPILLHESFLLSIQILLSNTNIGIREPLFEFLAGRIEFFTNSEYNELMAEFREIFQAVICPIIIETINQPENWINQNINSYYINITRVLLMRRIGLTSFLSVEYFTECVIPSLKLTDEDISLFNENPEQFFYFCYNIDSDSTLTTVTPRNAFHFLAQILIRSEEFVPLLEQIFAYLVEGADNENELEVKMFTFSELIKVDPENEELFHFVANSISEIGDPILLATYISALIPFQIKFQDRMEIAFMCMTQAEEKCLILVALYLFRVSIQTGTDLSPYIEELVPIMLDLLGAICNPEPAKMIDRIIRHYPTLIEEYLSDIFTSLMGAWYSFEETPFGADPIGCISQIISILPENSEFLVETTPYLFELFHEQFSNNPKNHCENQMLEIMIEIANKIEPIPIMFEMLGFLNEMLESEQFFYLSNLFVDYANALLKKPQTLLETSNIEYINRMINLIIQTDSSPEGISSALMLGCVLLQYGGKDVIAITEYAAKGIDSQSQKIRISAASLFASSAIVSTDSFPIEIETFLEMKEDISVAEIRIIKLYIGALIALAMNGSEECAFFASDLFPTLLRPDDFDIDEEGDGIQIVDVKIVSLPSDDLTVSDLGEKLLSFTSLDDERKEVVREVMESAAKGSQAEPIEEEEIEFEPLEKMVARIRPI